MALSRLEKRYLKLYKQQLEEGATFTDAKRKLGIYEAIRQDEVSAEFAESVDSISEDMRIQRHTIPPQHAKLS